MDGVCVLLPYFSCLFCIHIGLRRVTSYDILSKAFEFMNYVIVRKMIIVLSNFLGFHLRIHPFN